MMTTVFTLLAAVMVANMLLPLYRTLVGTSVFDRLLGANAIGSHTVVLVCVIGVIFGRLDMFVDIALAYAVLNFIGVIAVAKYLESPRNED